MLYGGTASGIATRPPSLGGLRLFLEYKPFQPIALLDSIPYVKHAEMIQFQDNTTLTALVDRNGPVKLSFF